MARDFIFRLKKGEPLPPADPNGPRLILDIDGVLKLLNPDGSITNLDNGVIPYSPEYKVYSALLTQSGTNNPVATVLENTLDTEIVFGYNSAGSYFVNCGTPGKFPQQKTGILIQPTSNNMRIYRVADDSFILNTYTNSTTTAANSILNQTLIEIRVYN
jgi:hypothetical protein